MPILAAQEEMSNGKKQKTTAVFHKQSAAIAFIYS
jgi:hypothetical protein